MPFKETYRILDKIKDVCTYQKGIWIEGEDHFNNTPIIEGKSFFYRGGYTGSEELTLGTVPYTCKRNNYVCLKFGIGELKPNISREAVELNVESNALIDKRYEESIEELAKYLVYKDFAELVTFSINEKANFDFNGQIYNIRVPNKIWSYLDISDNWKIILKSGNSWSFHKAFTNEFKGTYKRKDYFHNNGTKFIVEEFPKGNFWQFLKEKYKDIGLYKLEELKEGWNKEEVEIWNYLTKCVTDFSDLTDEFKAWEKEKRESLKLLRVYKKTIKDKSQIFVKYLRANYKDRDECVLQEISVKDLEKKKCLCVYSDDPIFLKHLWKTVPGFIYINKKMEGNRYCKAEELFTGKFRTANRKVEGFIIQDAFNKAKLSTHFEEYNFFKGINPALYKTLKQYKDYIKMYNVDCRSNTFMEGVAEDHIKRGLISKNFLETLEKTIKEVSSYKINSNVYHPYNFKTIYLEKTLREITFLKAEINKLKRICKV